MASSDSKKRKGVNPSKICVVTAITDGKDTLRKQPRYKNVDYIAYLDGVVNHSQWEVRSACQKFKNPVMNAKIHKVLTHKFVSHSYIVWMDGNMKLKKNPQKLVDLMGKYDFAFFSHHSRQDIYHEIRACLQVKRGNPEELKEQQSEYLKRGIPRHIGLCELPAFVRKNNDNANSAFEKWWAEICRYSSRDQVSFPVAFQGYEWKTIPGNVFGENDYFAYKKHNK